MKKNILLLGSNSFVGKNIKDFFLKRENIFFLSDKFNDYDILNLSNKLFFKKYFSNIPKKINHIFFLVHLNKDNLKNENFINIKLIKKILYVQSIYKSHFIYFSSVNSFSLNKNNKYSFVKKSIENYINKKSSNFLILRLSTIVQEKSDQIIGGKNGKSLFFINYLIKKLKFLPILGKGDFIHTVLHIEDLCKFLVFHLNKRIFNNLTINLFNGQYLTYKMFIQYISRYLNKKYYFIYIPVFFVRLLIRLSNFFYFKKINLQMLNNVISQKIEFDYSNKIHKFVKFKQIKL